MTGAGGERNWWPASLHRRHTVLERRARRRAERAGLAGETPAG
ncbi:MAG TPA: hypothetical protein VGM53_15565 [Streptosporangiaceae bacterium]